MRQHKSLDRARQLRQESNPPEQIVWAILRNRRIGGLKFRRQEQIGPYFVDFCCLEAKLVVEVDGASHRDKFDYDKRREEYLKQQGYRVVRITNADVNDRDAVARLIAREAGIEWSE